MTQTIDDPARRERIAALFLALYREFSGAEVVSVPSAAPAAVPVQIPIIGHPFDAAVVAWSNEMAARGCRPGSVSRMATLVRAVAKSRSWASVEHVRYADAVGFLAEHRTKDKPWAGTTYDQAVSTLRVFGEFCRRSGWCSTNPLIDLQSCGEPGDHGSRALTVEEARALLRASLARHRKSRRAKGFAPLYWLTMLYTGLRYAEAGSLRWADLDLGESPMLYTDPKAEGNKARRRDRIPLRPDLVALLVAHRRTLATEAVMVFPEAPTRATWHLDREAAGISRKDARGRPATSHSCRKTFCTWLDAQAIPRGLVSRLARHAQGLTEERYIDHGVEAEVAAIRSLPEVWPEVAT
jgi:integrase